MKYKWLNRKKNSNLIIFFNGWGLDDSVVRHLEFDSYDVIMFYDYNTLTTSFAIDDLNIYKTKSLIAWSMGVMVATNFNLDYNSTTAINGTLRPIDAQFGIHPKIYNLTIKGFDEEGRGKVIQNMFVPQIDSILITERELKEQKSELEAIKKYSSNENFKYSKILISDEDKIIPTKSQCNYWGCKPNIHGGHCIFNKFKKWSELL